MDSKTFDKIVDEATKRISEVLVDREADYASADDRLHNFAQASAIRGISKCEAVTGMQLKHTVSMEDIRRDLIDGKVVSKARFMEKAVDEFNYNLLLLGCAIDQGLIKE